MLQKSSYVLVSDSCGAWVAQIFHIYRGSRHRSARTCDFVKVSTRTVAPMSWITKGFKSKALVVRTRYKSAKPDGSYICSSENSVVFLKKRMTPRGKEIFGPLTYGLHRRKVIASFSGII